MPFFVRKATNKMLCCLSENINSKTRINWLKCHIFGLIFIFCFSIISKWLDFLITNCFKPIINDLKKVPWLRIKRYDYITDYIIILSVIKVSIIPKTPHVFLRYFLRRKTQKLLKDWVQTQNPLHSIYRIHKRLIHIRRTAIGRH